MPVAPCIGMKYSSEGGGMFDDIENTANWCACDLIRLFPKPVMIRHIELTSAEYVSCL